MSDHLKHIPPAAQLLGREIISIDPQSGEVKLRFMARGEFANRHGTVQGGSHLTAVTTRLDTQFLKPAGLGEMVATASVMRRDDRSAEVIAELADSGGQIVATARAELRIRARHRS